jgi:guanylate kinase
MEKQGHHYHFVTGREFTAMRDRGEFLEWAKVHGNYYGTPRSQVEAALAAGRDVILEIDVQGAASVKRQMPEAFLIFIEAPSMAVLEERLRKRRTERENDVSRRLEDAYDELRRKKWFDGVVVNTEVDQAVAEVLQLMTKLKESRT